MSYPAISLATATVGRHRCPQKRLQTARQPPVYPNSSPDHRACHSLTPFRCPHAVHPCPSVDSGLNQTALGEYRASSPVAVYHLEVIILVDLADDQEAYEELGKYVSGDSASSVKTLMDAVVVTGYKTIQCIRAGPRRRHDIGGASYWGCSFWVEASVS